MSRNKDYKYLVADFETTVYTGQKNTEVWASAVVEMYTEDVQIFHSIGDTFKYFKSLNCNLVVYYHNLKFDGSFWIYYLLYKLKFKQATKKVGETDFDLRFLNEQKMPNKSFKYTISNMGQWYSIYIKIGRHIIEFRDSLKLLPFTVKKIGKDFQTKHQKLEMEYTGFRFAGCEITDDEKKYIANDVLVVKEALEIMFNEGHNKLTIGSCCLSEFKKIVGDKRKYVLMYPDLFDDYFEGEYDYGSVSIGEYIRKSYKGGWCYLVPEKANKLYSKGITADVNSLYPSMMHSDSGNKFPVGFPKFWQGNFIPDIACDDAHYYFVRVRCRFRIKKDHLPFIQIKGSHFYRATEMLTSSDFTDRKTGQKARYRKDEKGNIIDSIVTLTLTCTDYELFLDHYDVYDFEILDGCYFTAMSGIFDGYINKYAEIKKNSKGARRQIAKLFLNNLYGKMASSKDSTFKYIIQKDGTFSFVTIPAAEKEAGYIPIGSAITSYARNFTIRTAQKNYYGANKRGFIYADTDSIHCDLDADELIGVPVHPTDFNHWSLEASWDEAIFVRQKTYIEHVTHENLMPIEKPYYNVKCAGMPERCKQIFLDNYKITDFKLGLELDGKLVPKRIEGGTLLVETTYKMH